MDFIIIPLFVLFGIKFTSLFKNDLDDYSLSILKKLWYYHIIFGVYYCFFIQGDAIGYWKQPKLMTYEEFIFGLYEQIGTYFMYSLNYVPSNILDLSYLTGTIIYSFIGFIGICFFYVYCYNSIPYNSSFKGYVLFPWLFFLPNLHFWSCAVGKDTLLFFAIGSFVYGLMNPLKRFPLLLLAIFISYLIRPHITLFLAISFSLAYMFSSKVSTFQRLILSVLLIGLGIAILPTVMEYAKIEEASVESFSEFAEAKSDVLSRASVDTRIDISSYPFPLKVFTFLFRPFFFDINGIPAVLASFENLLLLLLTFNVFKSNPIITFRKAPFIIKGLVLFLIFGTLAFSQTLGNVGVMIRMRNMFLPGLLIFILWSYSLKQENENIE